jgi:hypothetical protein
MGLTKETLSLRCKVLGLISGNAALMDVPSYAQSSFIPLLQNQS